MKRVVLCCLLTFALTGCAEAKRNPAAKAPVKKKAKLVLIKGVPHIRQKPDFCGEACVAMCLGKLGRKEMNQDYVFNQSGLDPVQGRGCYTRELAVALAKIGFDPGQAGAWVPAKTFAKGFEAEWGKLYADLRQGIPSIVCMRYADGAKTTEHFRLVLGYDPGTKEVIYHEPAVANGAYLRMSKAAFAKLWPLKYKQDKWLLVRFRLKPGKLAAAARPAPGFSAADYAQHIIKLKEKVPAGFTVVLQKPFVVVGDEKPAVVHRRAMRTVKWAVDMLKQDYFKKDPKMILTIWLFKNKKSYRKYNRELFNEEPDTPFGYYSDEHHALVMNIATGGGTLVHEIVHPFVAANFPKCPAWFNEGLASLYEQCGGRDGKIRGFTNWRLAGLQKAIRGKKVPSFKTLTGTSTYEFYQEDPGTNYSQARYLCYYLQEHGLLRKYYHAFVKNVDRDPTGYGTLKTVLGEKDVAAFKKRWQAWVLKLRFPEP